MFKNCRDWVCIYQDKNEHSNEMLNFLKNNPLDIKHTYSSEFSNIALPCAIVFLLVNPCLHLLLLTSILRKQEEVMRN